MSERPAPSTTEMFKERVTALIGGGIFVIAGTLAILAAYSALTSGTDTPSFANSMDVLSFWGSLLGTVVGYYFGRIGVEKRAETAENSMQMAQTAWTVAERQAAKAVAKLEVEETAREALTEAKDLAQQGQAKAVELVEVAQEARKEAENQVGKAKQTIDQLADGLHSLNGQIQEFKGAASQAVEEGLAMFDMVLDDEEATETARRATESVVDMQKIDQMSDQVDALLRMAEGWKT